MSVEISNIQNEVLRHAAEVADLNDNTANSGKLDQKELSVFIREAVKTDCNMADIRAVCDQVGVEHATDEVKASMEKLNQLQKLEKELEYQNDILKKRNDEIKKLEQKDRKRENKNLWISLGSFVGGAATGALIGAGIGSAFAGFGALPGAFVGGLLGGFFTSMGISNVFHDKNTESETIYNYETKARTIKEKVNELENQMKKIENSL